jgi:radical SAM superfamily enzyme
MGDNNDEYLSLIIDILRRLDPSIAVERIASTAPRHLLLHSPLSGIRIDTLRNNLVERMQRGNIRQGDML